MTDFLTKLFGEQPASPEVRTFGVEEVGFVPTLNIPEQFRKEEKGLQMISNPLYSWMAEAVSMGTAAVVGANTSGFGFVATLAAMRMATTGIFSAFVAEDKSPDRLAYDYYNAIKTVEDSPMTTALFTAKNFTFGMEIPLEARTRHTAPQLGNPRTLEIAETLGASGKSFEPSLGAYYLTKGLYNLPYAMGAGVSSVGNFGSGLTSYSMKMGVMNTVSGFNNSIDIYNDMTGYGFKKSDALSFAGTSFALESIIGLGTAFGSGLVGAKIATKLLPTTGAVNLLNKVTGIGIETTTLTLDNVVQMTALAGLQGEMLDGFDGEKQTLRNAFGILTPKEAAVGSLVFSLALGTGLGTLGAMKATTAEELTQSVLNFTPRKVADDAVEPEIKPQPDIMEEDTLAKTETGEEIIRPEQTELMTEEITPKVISEDDGTELIGKEYSRRLKQLSSEEERVINQIAYDDVIEITDYTIKDTIFEIAQLQKANKETIKKIKKIKETADPVTRAKLADEAWAELIASGYTKRGDKTIPDIDAIGEMVGKFSKLTAREGISAKSDELVNSFKKIIGEDSDLTTAKVFDMALGVDKGKELADMLIMADKKGALKEAKALIDDVAIIGKMLVATGQESLMDGLENSAMMAFRKELMGDASSIRALDKSMAKLLKENDLAQTLVKNLTTKKVIGKKFYSETDIPKEQMAYGFQRNFDSGKKITMDVVSLEEGLESGAIQKMLADLQEQKVAVEIVPKFGEFPLRLTTLTNDIDIDEITSSKIDVLKLLGKIVKGDDSIDYGQTYSRYLFDRPERVNSIERIADVEFSETGRMSESYKIFRDAEDAIFRLADDTIVIPNGMRENFVLGTMGSRTIETQATSKKSATWLEEQTINIFKKAIKAQSELIKSKSKVKPEAMPKPIATPKVVEETAVEEVVKPKKRGRKPKGEK